MKQSIHDYPFLGEVQAFLVGKREYEENAYRAVFVFINSGVRNEVEIKGLGESGREFFDARLPTSGISEWIRELLFCRYIRNVIYYAREIQVGFPKLAYPTMSETPSSAGWKRKRGTEIRQPLQPVDGSVEDDPSFRIMEGLRGTNDVISHIWDNYIWLRQKLSNGLPYGSEHDIQGYSQSVLIQTLKETAFKMCW